MDASQIQGIGQAQGTGSAVQAKNKSVGRDDFITMFLAQLKNQDPLNPMQGSEFAAQLAQFSSVEQLYNVNENLQAMKTSQDESSRLQALDFIGKEVVAKGNAISLEEGKTAEGRFDLSASADCTVAVKDANGYTVRILPLGFLSPGSHTFQWNGESSAKSQLSPGDYSFSVLAKSATGAYVTADPRISGKVTGVNLQNGSVQLYVGQTPVSVSDVIDIAMPAAQGS